METKANYVVIGLLALVAIAGGFGFVYWFQHTGGVGERAFYRVNFQGSAQGLRTGAAVMFNGIRVGEVTDLRLDTQNPKQVAATISIAAATPIRSDTRATLTFQGLTGIASLALRGGEATAPALTVPSGEKLPVIATDADASQDITEQAREVMRKVELVVTENQESIRAAIKNIDTFTAVLARNSDRFDRILAGVENLTGGPNNKGEVAETIQAYHNLADNLDKRTADITTDVRRAVGTLERTIRTFERNPQRLLFGNPSGTTNQR